MLDNDQPENVFSASGQVEEQNFDEQQVADPEKQPDVAENTPEKQPDLQAKPDLANNIRALREKATRIERERDEYMRRLEAYEAKSKDPEEDLSIDLGENDLAEGKHLTKIQKQLKRQREELQRTQDETRSLLVETRLKAEYPDIEKVVSADNIKALSELYPEIAQTLNASSDYYSKAKAAYTMIKKFGIHVEDNYSSEREAVAKNAAKPRPLASVSPQQAESPLSRANAFANGLTEELKAQLRKEMDAAVRNL